MPQHTLPRPLTPTRAAPRPAAIPRPSALLAAALLAGLATCVAALTGCNPGPAASAPAPGAGTARPLNLVDNAAAPVDPHARPIAETAPPTRTGASGVSVDSLRNDVYYLASPRLEGRGVGTQGLDLAADYVATRFAALGLKPVPGLDGYFQTFEMTTVEGVLPATEVVAGGRKLKAEEMSVTAMSPDKSFAGAVAFAGYGISSGARGYDDYKGLDVKGKVVLAMRYEPHDPATGKSRWSKAGWSAESNLETKAAAAGQRGAVALLVFNPPSYHELTGDPLPAFRPARVDAAGIPVIYVRRTVAADLIKAGGGGDDLARIQAAIDAAGKPAPVELKDVSVSGNVALKRVNKPVKNVVGMLPGTGERAGEYVIVGAHYDHLGWGGPGSLMNLPLLQRVPGVTEPGSGNPHGSPANPHGPPANPHGPATRPASQPTTVPVKGPGSPAPTTRAIHFGADDNASGTAAMLELARLASRGPAPARTVLFCAFTAEESGLVGSARFCKNPPVDLKKVVAMLNLDMVGRVRKNLLYVGGHGTAVLEDPQTHQKTEPLDRIIKRADTDSPLEVKNFGKGGLGPSDHMSFAMKKVPVLFLFTGTHADYHRPTDTPEKINYDGMAKVVDFSREVLGDLQTMPAARYNDEADRQSMMSTPLAGEPGARRASLGIIPSYGQEDEGKGVLISGTTPGTAAEKAGLKEGDIILSLGDKPTSTLMEMTAALASFKPGDKVVLKYKRGGQVKTVEVTLGQRQGG